MGGGVPLTDGPVRVALDATALGSGRGGDETYMRGLVDGLVATARADDKVRLYVRPGVAGPEHPSFRTETVHPSGSLRLLGPLSIRAARVDGLFVGYTHLPLAVRKPSALVVTDLSFRHHPEYYPLVARRRLNALVPRQARAAAGVITLSDFCRRDLIESYQLDPTRVHVVPCAVSAPADLDEPMLDRLRRELRARGIDRPFILYLGNLHPRKNVALLVRAFTAANIEGVQLILAGGPWWHGGGEEAALLEAPAGAVVALGRVDEEQRSYLLRHALALAYPSRFEGFGLPPIEAMSVGTPVLASDAAAIPETCGDAALLIDAGRLDTLAAGLEQIVYDAERRACLRSAGPARAAEFSVERTGRAGRAAIAQIMQDSS